MAKRYVKTRLWECHQFEGESILSYFDRLEALQEQAPGDGVSDKVLLEVVCQNTAQQYEEQLANMEAQADATGTMTAWTLAHIHAYWTAWELALPTESLPRDANRSFGDRSH